MQVRSLNKLPLDVVTFEMQSYLNLKDQASLGSTSKFLNQAKCTFWQQPAVQDKIAAAKACIAEKNQDKQAAINAANRQCPYAPKRKR